jgi:hypothetical protein
MTTWRPNRPDLIRLLREARDTALELAGQWQDVPTAARLRLIRLAERIARLVGWDGDGPT